MDERGAAKKASALIVLHLAVFESDDGEELLDEHGEDVVELRVRMRVRVKGGGGVGEGLVNDGSRSVSVEEVGEANFSGMEERRERNRIFSKLYNNR